MKSNLTGKAWLMLANVLSSELATPIIVPAKTYPFSNGKGVKAARRKALKLRAKKRAKALGHA